MSDLEEYLSQLTSLHSICATCVIDARPGRVPRPAGAPRDLGGQRHGVTCLPGAGRRARAAEDPAVPQLQTGNAVDVDVNCEVSVTRAHWCVLPPSSQRR